ncbi:YihY/virulence factor BrkB family protein [Paraburkholderia sacchari]|uniref:YihY/virulence factor BrkB family protein n=1 Tax=Paraburkholderia sacchari TaxID=159450 RepID=UPI000541ADA3|nr:YihY/virulence factor BrkB family protein [Paraburkholderia sacchari]NLP64688.1 YihY/virulence factor BrkB family protein [Paraburkholderia sacchari]
MATLLSERLGSAARKEASWVVSACRQFIADRCPSLAASIAFYSAFSLAPTLVMVIAVAGWFFGADAARGELFRQVHNVLGNDAAAGVSTIVENAHRAGGTGSIAAMISLAMLAVGASATFASLNSALNIVWPATGLRTSSVLALVRVRLISFGLVLGVAILLFVSVVLDTVITFVGRWIWGETSFVIIGNLLQLTVGLLVLAFAFAALLRFLPDAVVRWRDAMVGGIVAAVLFSVGKKLFALYLAHAGMATAFGAAGSLAVLLMWLYFSAAVLLLGAEFSAARARLHDPRGAWGFLAETPPGSRAKLASVLAASTIAPMRETATGGRPVHAVPIGNTDTVANPQAGRDAAHGASAADAPRQAIGQVRAEGGAFARGALTRRSAGSLQIRRSQENSGLPQVFLPPLGGPDAKRQVWGRSVVNMEKSATEAAARTLLRAGRTVAATNRYVQRHPWRSVAFVASAALAVTAAAGRRRAAAPDSHNPGD